MHNRESSWQRRSDRARITSGVPQRECEEKEARLEVWEDDGGKTALSNEMVRILIVDNDMGSADSLQLMLHAAGYAETRVAYSGHAALAIASDFRPHVVMLDLSLFDMGGYEVAQSLRERAPSGRLRLIALTFSPALAAAREEARAAGFERYLVKPFRPGDLTDLLQTLSR